MSSAVISVRDLSSVYDKNLISDNMDFSVREEDFVVIVGKGSAGKPTLVNLILHNLNNYDGKIKLLSTDMKEDNHFRDLAYISQNSVLPHRNFPTTIEEAVKIHLSFLKKKADIGIHLKQMGLSKHRKKALDELSGGQLQRLGVVLALIKSVKVIFLDEPTSGIDRKSANEFSQNLSALKNQNRAAIVITHRLDLVKKYIDHAIKIKDKKSMIINDNKISL